MRFTGFRDEFIAASLKRQCGGADLLRGARFRDEFIAASLKLHHDLRDRPCIAGFPR